MSVQTNNSADIGSYTVSLTVSLTDYAAIASITKFFQITITCGVKTLGFVAPLIPNLTTLLVGIDSQPLTVPFLTSQFPNCGNTVSFVLTPNTNPFMTLTTSTIQSGQWTVDNATISQHNTYTYTLTASVDDGTATASFDIFIKDPCSSSVF